MTDERIALELVSFDPFRFLAISSDLAERTSDSLRVVSDAPDVVLMTAAVTIAECSVETLAGLLGAIESEIGTEDRPIRVEETILGDHDMDNLRRYIWRWGPSGTERLSLLVAFTQGHMLVVKLNYPNALDDVYASVFEAVSGSMGSAVPE